LCDQASSLDKRALLRYDPRVAELTNEELASILANLDEVMRQAQELSANQTRSRSAVNRSGEPGHSASPVRCLGLVGLTEALTTICFRLPRLMTTLEILPSCVARSPLQRNRASAACRPCPCHFTTESTDAGIYPLCRASGRAQLRGARICVADAAVSV